MQKKILLMLSVLLVMITSVAYSALSTSLSITSEVKFRVLADIRVNSVTFVSASGAEIGYESEYSKNTVSNGFTLPTSGSSISYRVHIDNAGDVDYSIYDILKTTNNSGLNVAVSGYNMRDVIPAKTSVDLVLTYTTSSPSESVINVVNTFDFKRVFYVRYETGTSEVIPAQTKYQGVNLALTNTQPTKNGYTFSKWNTKSDGSGVNYNSGASYTVDEDVTLYARYNLATYNINYVLNGGTNNANNPSTYTIESDNITLADASKTGYTFKGWTGNGTTTPTKNLVLPKGSYGDKTFTANFKDETDPEITVTSQDGTVNYLTTAQTINAAFNASNASIAYKINATDEGSGISTIEYAITNSATAPTSGWSTTTNGNHSDIKNRGSYYLHVRATDVAGNTTTVTTKVITIRFRVAYYDYFGASATVSENQYYTGTALTSRTPSAHSGYSFDGWYNSTALTTKTVNANTSYTPTGSIQLYGKWTPVDYAITYALNNGTNNSNNPDSYNIESENITLAAPSKTLTFKGNYNATSGANAANGTVTIGSNTTKAQTFAGWTGSNGTTAQTSVTIPTGSTGDRSYEAHWTAVAGTVPTVTRTGYTCGWSTSSTGTTIEITSGGTFPTSLITEGMSSTVNLYAVCNPNTYQLTINPQGGTYNSTTSNSTKTMTYDSSNNNDIGVPTRSGYTFDGWYIEANSKTNQLFNNTGKNTALSGYFSAAYSTGVWKKTSPVTVYAHWSKAVSSTTNSVSPTTYIYDGTAKSPTETVKDGSTTLTSGTDYTVAFSNNTNVGTATATITGKNVYNATTKAYYTGTATVNYYINNAKITWDTNSCGTISGTSPAYVRKGSTGVFTEIRNSTAGTIPTVSKSGYKFNGWYDGTTKVINGDGTIVAGVSNWTDSSKNWLITQDKTLKASCTREDYTITYSMNNGINNANNPSSYNTESSAITLLAPTKILTFKGNYNSTSGANGASGQVTIGSNTTANQTFAGWTGSNGSTAQTTVTIPSGSTGNKSYTAHWTAVAGTLPTVTRTGYTCGWSTSSTGTTIEIASGGSYATSRITEGMAATVNLYAVCVDNIAPTIVSATPSTVLDLRNYIEFNATDAGTGVSGYNITTTNTAPTTWIPVVNAVETTTETKYEYNAAWARVFHHNNHWGEVYFTDADEAKSITNNNDKYSVLENIANYKNSSNWEFLLQYPDVSSNGYNRWTQTSNPITTNNTAVGYTAIGTPTWSTYFSGLALSSSPRSTLLDGSPAVGNWCNAVGTYDRLYDGMPGSCGGIGTVNLWSRIDNLTTTTSNNLTRRVGDISADGTYYLWVKDAAGNTSSQQITINKVDTTKPTATISSTNNVATSQTVTLTLGDNKALSKYYWGMDNASNSNLTYTLIANSPTSSTPTATVSNEGIYYVSAVDKAGNKYYTSKTFFKTTLNANGGSVSPAYVITMDGNSYTLPNPTRNGYNFAGWYTDSGLTTAVTLTNGKYKPTATGTLYAKWTPASYTVTAKANGGSISSTSGWSGTGNTATKSVTYLSTYGTLPTVARNGYTFNGWNGKNLLNYNDFSNYNNWSETLITNGKHPTYASNPGFVLNLESGKTYTISYTTSGTSSGEFPDYFYLCKIDNNEGNLVTYLTTNVIVKTNYTFTVEEGESYFLRMAASPSNFNSRINTITSIQLEVGTTATTFEPYYITSSTQMTTPFNHDINARWTRNNYTITYGLNNGTVSTANPTTYHVESSAITLNNPTKTLTFKGNANATSGANASTGTVTIGSNTTQAQTFAGWSGTGITGNSTSVTIPTGSTGDRSYTAHWTAVAGTVPTVSKTGYTCGWSTSSTGTTIEIASGGSYATSRITEGMSTTVNLYAVCTPNTYLVTYNYNVTNYQVGVDRYIDTDYTIDWDRNFKLNSTINFPTLGQRYLLFGNYNSSKELNLELINNALRMYSAGDKGTSTATLKNNTDIALDFTYTASNKGLLLTSTGTDSNATASGINDKTGLGVQTLRIGTDNRTDGTFKAYTLKSASITDYYVYGGTISKLPSNPTRPGYTFNGWYTAASGGTQITSSTSVPAGNTTYYAHWTPVNYSISYALNNGTVSTANPTSYNIESSPITLNNPTKTLTFKGNYNSTSGTNAASGQVTIGSNTTKAQTFAGWSGTGLSSNTVNVTIPTGSIENRSYTAHWTAVAGTVPTVTRTGYTCGWNRSSSGTTIEIESGGTFPTSYISEGMSTTVNLYAVCNPNTYQLTINPNGGTYNSTTNNSTKTMTYDSSNNNDIGVPTRDGYTFDGWYLETNSKTNQLFNNTGKNTALSGYFSAAYDTGVWKKTSPVTVYAHWSKAVSSTTNSVSPTTYIYDGTAKSPAETVKDGSTTLTNGTDYTVAFSNNTNVGTATATITGKNVYNATTKAYYTGTATVNYYINNATLTFDKGSCTSTSGTTTLYTYKGATKVYTGIRETTTTGTIPTASKSGYTFQGWYTAASGGSKVLNANGTFTGTAVTNYTNATSWQTVANQTLYAQCGRDSYSITYSMNNGTNNSNNPSTYTVESAAITLAAPSKTLTFKGNANATSGANAASGTVTIGSNTTKAQTFAGWTGSNGSTAQTSVTIPTGSTGDKNYTAHWTAVAGTVPTVTRTGYTCGWNRSSTGTTIEIASGANFPTSYISEGMSSTVNLYAVCTPNTYTIGYTMNGGPNPSTKPTSGTYDANVQISNPGNKTVTVTGNANNSGATVGSATSGTQTFTGWTSTTLGSNAKSGSSTSNYAAWTGTSTKNTYFKNLRESGTVTMVANWSGTVTLPTLSRAGYTCKWYTEATGGSEMGGSGATWTIPSASSTAVTAYARCTINSYTLTINPNGGTYNSTTSNTTVTQNYGTTYSVLNNPTKAGYIFGGWKLTSGNGDITYFQDTEKLKQYLINSSSANTPGVYNNNGNGTVTHTIISDSTSSTGYSMKIVTNGSANPGAGGFVNSNNSTSGAIYYHKIVAKVPSGYTLNIASNSMGIGYGYYWVTDNAGTGDWKTYIYATYSGQNGNFSSFGHVYASGSNNTSVTWYINESTMYRKGATLAQTQASNEVFRFVASNATLTAQWNNSGAAVTFDTNGGSWNTSYVANWTNGFYGVTSTIAKRDYVFGNSYGTHPGSTNYYWTPDSRVISKTGNTFAGWYTAETGGTQVFDADGKLKASVSGYSDANSKWTNYDSNVTLYARWSAVDHTVTYNTTENGGTGTVASQTVGYGSSIPLPTTGASKSGWTFVGWNTDKNATSALSSLTMGLDNVTLYAIYRKEAVTLTANWNANGATLSSTSQSSCQLASVYNNNTQATSCQVTAPTITRANYNIIGFNTTSTATTNNSSYNVSTGKLTLTSSNTGNTWYAITQAQPQLTATFAANNGATVASTSASCYVVGSNTSCQVTAPSVTPQSGFSHIGFNTTTSATSNSSSYNTSTNKLTISANGTWYPITRAQFTGTFTIQDSNAATQSGGTPSCYKYNGPGSCNIVAPTLTAKSGYTVLGWNTNQNATSASYASGATISISENTQFYSITKASTAITITFDRNTANSKATSQTPSGGTASTDTTVTVSCEKVNGATSCSVTSPTMAVTAGYHAVGYNTSATATSSSWNVNTAKSVSANATYYAITAPNTYSIKFNANCPTGTTASGSMSDLSMTYGTAKNLTANAFGCTNREFVGWATSASGTVAYNNQAQVNNLTTTNGGTFNLYAKWRLVTPPLPTTSGGTTRVYGSAGDVILTCNDNINMSSYPSGAVKYYSFGYSTTSDGNLGSWSTDQQSNTYSVSTNYIGTRYYACKVYVSTSTEASDVTIGTTRTSLTVRNAKITFNANGCGTITGTNPAYVQKGMANVYTGETNSTNGTIPYTSATGKTFTGWYSGSTQVINASKVVNASVSGWTDSQKKWLITEDKTLTAGCSNDPYTIGYTMNGGTNNSNNPSNYTVASPDITLAAPTKVLTFHGNANGVNNVSIGNDTTKAQGFAGWTGSNGTTAQTSVTITSGSTGNKSYTAHWTAVAGTLPTVELDGYTCKWNTKSDGTGTDYASGGTFPASAISESMATTVNLYAVCTQSSYTITANVNGGTISTLNGWTASGNNATKLIASGGTYGTLPTVTAPTGKVFVGWYTQASGETQITSSTQLVSNSSHIIYAHYADVWAENIGYSRTFGSVVCSDAQCAIDQLWAMLSQY